MILAVGIGFWVTHYRLVKVIAVARIIEHQTLLPETIAGHARRFVGTVFLTDSVGAQNRD